MRTPPAVVAILLTGIHTVHAQDTGISRARVAWSAFTCATFAEMMGNEPEQKRLFDRGYEAGKEFLDAVLHNTASEAERRDAPVGVLMLLGGPTADFMLGRIFESASGNAYDTVVKQDSAGVLMSDPSNWVHDDGVKKMLAETKYQQSNCALIR